jgi:SAM-dependent methyltransferase
MTLSGHTSESVSAALEAENEWLKLGAIDKAESIIALTQGLSIRSVLEIGSGTGALLNRLDGLEFAERYYAVEPSIEMFNLMMERAKPTRLVDAEATTIQESRLSRQQYDLAILCHVLEHLEAPSDLLSDVIKLAEYVVVEVPLDGSISGDIRAAIKARMSGRPRHNNAAGHIQFFSKREVESLVHWCGGEVIRSRLYLPTQRLNQPHLQSSQKRIYHRLTTTLSKLVGSYIWANVYHGHYAVLVKRRAAIAADERTQWTSVYYQ